MHFLAYFFLLQLLLCFLLFFSVPREEQQPTRLRIIIQPVPTPMVKENADSPPSMTTSHGRQCSYEPAASSLAAGVTGGGSHSIITHTLSKSPLFRQKLPFWSIVHSQSLALETPWAQRCWYGIVASSLVGGVSSATDAFDQHVHLYYSSCTDTNNKKYAGSSPYYSVS